MMCCTFAFRGTYCVPHLLYLKYIAIIGANLPKYFPNVRAAICLFIEVHAGSKFFRAWKAKVAVASLLGLMTCVRHGKTKQIGSDYILDWGFFSRRLGNGNDENNSGFLGVV